MDEATGPLGNIELAATTFYVSDLDAALAWYGEVLGLEPTMVGADGDRYAAFLMGGALVVLEPLGAAIDPATPGSESATVNLVLHRDPHEVHEELCRRGVRCSEILRSPNFESFMFRDLDGNRYYASRPVSEEARGDVKVATSRTAAS